MSSWTIVWDGTQIKEAQIGKIYGANMGSTWVLSAPDGPLLAP